MRVTHRATQRRAMNIAKSPSASITSLKKSVAYFKKRLVEIEAACPDQMKESNLDHRYFLHTAKIDLEVAEEALRIYMDLHPIKRFAARIGIYS